MVTYLYPDILQTWNGTIVWRDYMTQACMMTMQVCQTIVLVIILCMLISLAPIVRNTLNDVSVTLPEMKNSTEHLTWMVPEVARAINILDRVCVALGMSNCSK